MENRVILAFVLSLVVFVGWGFLVTLIQGPPPQKPKTAQNKTDIQPSPVPPAQKALPGQPALPPATEQEAAVIQQPAIPQTLFPGKEKMVTIATDRTRITLSTKGGVVQSIVMPKYKNDDGTQVDLVKREEGGPFPLSLEASDPAVTNILQNAYYETSSDYLELSPSRPEGKVTLKLAHSSGLEVVREYTFNYEGFMFGVETRISAQGYAAQNLQYRVLWGPGLGGYVASQTDMIVFSGPTTFVNNERIENSPDDFSEKVEHRGDLQWTGFQNKYFAAALVPEQGIKSGVVKKNGERVYVGLDLESVQSAASSTHFVYAGTKELQILEESGHKLIRLIDYGWLGNKFAFLVKPLLKTLNYLYSVIPNYGLAIIIITVIIKILFFPLTHKSFKSMKGMQKVQPYVKIIQERHKDNRQKMNEEMLELYKKHRVNPLGGCLPMLLQIPVFIALYHALFFSIELRGAPFFGWITDLSVADPYYVYPVLMGASMFLQQKLSPAIGDPMQQKIMMFLPILFTFLFMSFPSGLVIYWTVNNVLTITQQYYIYHIAKD